MTSQIYISFRVSKVPKLKKALFSWPRKLGAFWREKDFLGFLIGANFIHTCDPAQKCLRLQLSPQRNDANPPGKSFKCIDTLHGRESFENRHEMIYTCAKSSWKVNRQQSKYIYAYVLYKHKMHAVYVPFSRNKCRGVCNTLHQLRGITRERSGGPVKQKREYKSKESSKYHAAGFHVLFSIQ